MRFQVRTTWLFCSTAFAAIGTWALTWPPKLEGVAGCVVLAAFGGAIGALFGRTLPGVLCGLLTFAILVAVLVALLALGYGHLA